MDNLKGHQKMSKGTLTWTLSKKEGRDLQDVRILSTPDFPESLTEHNPNLSFGVCPTDIALITQGVSEKMSNLPTANRIVSRKMKIGTRWYVGQASVIQVSPGLLPATQMTSLSLCLSCQSLFSPFFSSFFTAGSFVINHYA